MAVPSKLRKLLKHQAKVEAKAEANKLCFGDNLDVLRKHIQTESVDPCYIDPPFNSKRNYNQIYYSVGEEDRAQAQAFIDTWVERQSLPVPAGHETSQLIVISAVLVARGRPDTC